MRIGAIGLMLLAIGGTALAAGWDRRFGFYASGTGGVAQPSGDASLDIDADRAGEVQGDYDLSLSSGVVATGAAGFYSGAWRGEFEIGYHANDVDGISGDAGDLRDAEGDFSAVSFMLNGFYDIPVAKPVVIYLGAGLGLAAVDLNSSGFGPGGVRYQLDADGAAVAWQVVAGLDVEVVNRVHLLAGYRLWSAFGGDGSARSEGGSTTIDISGDDSLVLPLIHTVEVGLRVDL